MKKSCYFLLFLVSIIAFLPSCKKCLCNEKAEKPYIRVNNTSTVSLTSDELSFTVLVRERGTELEQVKEQGNLRTNRIKSMLKSLGVESVTTASFSVSPYYSYTLIDKSNDRYDTSNEKKEFQYYEFYHSLKVKIDKLSERPDFSGKVIDHIYAVDNMAEIWGLNYTIKDNRKANASARKLSSESVMKKIKAYAEGAGVKVKGVREMREGYYTRDTGVSVEKAVGSSRNLKSANLAEASYKMLDVVEEAEDTSTQIDADRINVNAEVNYTSLLDKSKDSKLYVSGFHQLKVMPDVASFTIDINLKGDEPANLIKEGANVVRDIIEKLDGSCDITSTYYNLSAKEISYEYPSPIWHSDRAEKIESYKFEHSLRIRVDNFDKDNKLGKIIDKVGVNENFSIGSVSYSISDNSSYSAEARKGAANNGKEKCDIYATAAGCKCTGVFSIEENYSISDTEMNADELYYGKSGKKIYHKGEVDEGQTVLFPSKSYVYSQLTVTANI